MITAFKQLELPFILKKTGININNCKLSFNNGMWILLFTYVKEMSMIYNNEILHVNKKFMQLVQDMKFVLTQHKIHNTLCT